MAITATQKNGNTVQNFASGAYLDSAATPAAATITLGFKPRYIHWLDATDRIGYEQYDGMAAGTTLKSAAAGTRTLDSGDAAITNNGDGTVTIGAAAILQNKQYYWVARD